jgi:hypothetical protein
MTIIFSCAGCGRRLQVGEVYRGKRSKCPECAAISIVPGDPEPAPAAVPTAIQEAVPGAGVARVALSAAEDTIAVADVGPTCPGCRKVLPRGAVLCVSCGHDLRTGKQLETAYEPFEKRWDTGLGLPLRIGLLVALLCLCLPAGMLTREAFSAIALVFSGAVFLVLLLGTYIKLRVVRTARGKILLTKTWCICFIPAIRRQTNVRRYQAILIDATRGFSPVGWLVLIGMTLLLLAVGIIPGLIWWWWAFTHTTFHLSLRGARRSDEFVLYRCWDDYKMRDIIDTLQELASLRVERR